MLHYLNLSQQTEEYMPKKIFGAWLSDLLTKQNITQTEFARLCGVNRSAVHHWINNNRIPQREIYQTLTDVLVKITGGLTDDIKAELLWTTQLSIENKSSGES